MNPVVLIEKKRDGGSLTESEMEWMIRAYIKGDIPDYQMSAMLMAVYFQGMDQEEMACLTQVMIDSGDTVDLSSIQPMKVDKHSTGGVGDKVSLILAPLVASAGVPVPMMAGRGLGHTGGTLDKLESIPGFRVRLSETDFISQLQEIGCAIIGQTDKIAPADRLLYALRDVTGTVPSIPLICSSILSKKKAEGTDALVLDVKIGAGAFLAGTEATYELARTLVRLGNRIGIETVALITNMDQPLGNTIGNWLETMEAAEALQGGGPGDLMDVTLALGSIMLVTAGKAGHYQEGVQILQHSIASGEAWHRFVRMAELQGGDISVLNNPDRYPSSKHQLDIAATESGFIGNIDARQLGLAAMALGAGRLKKEEALDYKAGIRLYKKRGDDVETGETLMTLFTDLSTIPDAVQSRVNQAIEISRRPPDKLPLIEKIISADDEVQFPYEDQ